jgi:hypothetical protein
MTLKYEQRTQIGLFFFFFYRRQMSGQQVHEKVWNITNHQEM